MKRRLLVVEDEAEVIEMLQFRLEQENFSVVTSSNGVEALDQLRADPEFSCILCDISMPKMSGLEFLDEYVRLNLTHIPVIMLTAHSEVERLQQSLRLGVFDYVTKPFAFKELIDTVYRAVEFGRHAKLNQKQKADAWRVQNNRRRMAGGE